MVLPSVRYVSLAAVLATQAETVLRVTLDITNQELTVSFVKQTFKDAKYAHLHQPVYNV